MNSEDIKQGEASALCRTYARYPLAVSRGEGTRLFTPEGRAYTDLLAGIAVCNLGHSHPELVEVICAQAKKLIHVSNLFYQEEQVSLARRLLGTSHLERVFFCNSGAEANEGAIKLARRYMREGRGEERYEIITLSGSFHGRTLATLTATGQDKIKTGFGPLPEGFITVPFGDLDAMKNAMSDRTAAVLVEMIQGEGGVKPLPDDYARGLAALCAEKGVLLMIDEIQTGVGRTGKFWAYQHLGLTPDIVTVAKGLAGGLPMGAVMCTEEVSKGFPPGSHGTTFGGNALISAVADKVIEIIERDDLCGHAARLGDLLCERLNAMKSRFPEKIAEVRVHGLMVGIELTHPGADVWKALLEKGFILNLTQDTVLRLLPPLVISEEELAAFCLALESILAES
ncbi:MAG: aspartate aminotransferase family protein [Desulfomicrobium sp.]|nr:aspartate aminotransferase family protein [Pseudomonadota bacterium]MBV1712173.1 aspartate aminotransferase family protein [Desulfomicrobium sp.]MBU4572811.1 aspartate aminotransferase family protein [Pseudomonadota bacterium]MBU4594806.1 aspartate aminotransferase family protein [Pseudomonadota bacterium]MBV1718555.1 aspartate aminotransferase family protein [Desulfomicrobium sp.]